MIANEVPSFFREKNSRNSADPSIAIIGAGILGSSLAYRFSQEGFCVSVFEQQACTDTTSASFVAGGMLTPFCELESAPTCIAQPGLQSIEILKNWVKDLDSTKQVWFQTNGSLVVAHHRDRTELQRLISRLKYLGLESSYQTTDQGLFFPQEAHVHPHSLLQALRERSQKQGAQFYFQHPVLNYQELQDFHWILDCRGLQAKNETQGLRGVRGEIIEIECKEVQLNCPVRLMHPRYPIYIIPRPQDRFVIGATVTESESREPMTVRGALELLSAAMTVQPAFAEASIVDFKTHCRPAFSDHLPQVRWLQSQPQTSPSVLQINGFYRHGYLLSPYVVEKVLSIFDGADLPQSVFTQQGESLCLNLF
jgi:glycine oxidase